MTHNGSQPYPYLPADSRFGTSGLAPLLPLQLSLGTQTLLVQGLVDSGAALNVLPCSVGQQLGADWDKLTVPVRLGGILTGTEARGLLLSAVVGTFAPVRLAFAWARTDQVPVILGQVNFFLEFDVCFFRAQARFEVTRRSP